MVSHWKRYGPAFGSRCSQMRQCSRYRYIGGADSSQVFHVTARYAACTSKMRNMSTPLSNGGHERTGGSEQIQREISRNRFVITDVSFCVVPCRILPSLTMRVIITRCSASMSTWCLMCRTTEMVRHTSQSFAIARGA
jgi:hypothetical protein